jgi:hypothetical protein
MIRGILFQKFIVLHGLRAPGVGFCNLIYLRGAKAGIS